jgi:hypothetical protein
MYKYQAEISHVSQEELEAQDRALAKRLFGDAVKEELIINAELGIFPIEDDE